MTSRRTTTAKAATPPLLELSRHLQVVRRRRGAARRRLRAARRRDPRPGRRERRRQVDPDEDHRRRAQPTTTARCAIDGRPVHFRSPRDALAAGIGMVHQELSIVPDLTVAENVFLGQQPTTAAASSTGARMTREARAAPRRASASTSIRSTRMGALPVGLQQLIELARVLFSGARIIILDEPTSALSPPEVQRLFEVLRGVRAERPQHHLHLALPRRRAGDLRHASRSSATAAQSPPRRPAAIDKGWLIEHMIGRGHEELEESYTGAIALDSRPDAPVVLDVRGLERRPRLRATSRSTCGPARSWASMASWAAARSSSPAPCSASCAPTRGTLAIDGKPVRLAQHRRGAPRRHRLRAGEPALMLFRTEPVYKNMSISILGRIGRLLLKPAAERDIAARPCRGAADPAADGRDRCSATCRAATSRRWRSPNG